MEKDCLLHHQPQPHDHPEHPDGSGRKDSRKRLFWAFFIATSLLIVEIFGAIWTDSLALLGDAAHMSADCISLGVAIAAGLMAERLQSKRQSYGYYRLEVLAALINGGLLLFMAGFLLYEAFDRISNPHIVNGMGMLIVGSLGLFANLIMLKIMAHSHKENVNLRGVFFHILGDTLSSVAVILGAIFIVWTQSGWPDLIASCFVAVMISIMAVKLIWDSVQILLEGTPKHMDPEEIEQNLLKNFPAIRDIHDFHIWEITSHLFAMTAHVEADVSSLQETRSLIDGMNAYIRDHYGIGHTTFQVEPYVKSA